MILVNHERDAKLSCGMEGSLLNIDGQLRLSTREGCNAVLWDGGKFING